MKWNLNENWRFNQHFDRQMTEMSFDDSHWEVVRLPHTCKELPFHYFDESCYQMNSCYRKHFQAEESWQNSNVYLVLMGAAHQAEVFLNGKQIGLHSCGYTAFRVELSEEILWDQENVLTVRVDSRETLNQPPFGYVIDYMTYGGLYREAFLEVKDKIHLEQLYVRGVPGQDASVHTSCQIQGDWEGCTISQQIREWGQNKYQDLGEKQIMSTETDLEWKGSGFQNWELERPVLYEVRTQITKQGKVLDEEVTRIGFRDAHFRKDGFYLNGEKVKIRGLNRHQSYPYAGYAMPASIQQMDADVLKEELGLNAVRTSHYPQSQSFCDRCDELGLLVFTEMPGWQFIGDEQWKEQALENEKEMILQYRNHPSIILWGVRINESQDDDSFYQRTNQLAHELDPYRQTGGVRANKKSHLLEDVYTYNDFVHNGVTRGCEPKKKVTSNQDKPYLVTEYNGHMYPTKPFDGEEHRLEHSLRHARVLDEVAAQDDISGSFGWCMADYNTHRDFGSGDRICYHGVLDMFRNQKMAAYVYSSQQEKLPVLEVSSTFDIGEHPGSNLGTTYLFTNMEKVKVYKNEEFLKEYSGENTCWHHMNHGPVPMDDVIGDFLTTKEHFSRGKAFYVKKALNDVAAFGLGSLPKRTYLTIGWALLRYHMTYKEAVELYGKYVGNWGGTATTYRFDGYRDGKLVTSVTKAPVEQLHLWAQVNRTELVEKETYDVAAVRIQARDQNDNLAPYCQEPVTFKVRGPLELLGPATTSLQGGMTGTYVKTTGEEGEAVLDISLGERDTIEIHFQVKKEKGVIQL